MPQKTASCKRKAKNLQAVEQPLHAFLEELVVPPSLIKYVVSFCSNLYRNIIEGKIDENYAHDIDHLESIRKVIARYMAEGRVDSLPSLNDVIPVVQKLQTKVR